MIERSTDSADSRDPWTAPAALRAAIAADLTSVRPLGTPLVRTMAVLPLAALALLAAPATFDVRDLGALGPFWSWGASLLQALLGLALTTAALRESVPGRSWSRGELTFWTVAPIFSVTLLALVGWDLSPVRLYRASVFVGAICLAYGFATALPATVLTALLAVRAWPVRAGVAGWLAGLGGGLMADAGWRLFCHFSEPSHVLLAHLGGILAAGALGAVVTTRLAGNR